MEWLFQSAANVAQIATALIAAIALLFAWRQVTTARDAQREATAYAYYRDYLRLALEKPELANPNLSQGDSEIERDKYGWFVSIMLHACEEILLANPREHWERTIKDQLYTHEIYLRSERFRKRGGHYDQLSPKFQDFLDKTLKVSENA